MSELKACIVCESEVKMRLYCNGCYKRAIAQAKLEEAIKIRNFIDNCKLANSDAYEGLLEEIYPFIDNEIKQL